MKHVPLKLLFRVALVAMVLGSTPGAARTVQACPGIATQPPSPLAGPTMPACVPGADSGHLAGQHAPSGECVVMLLDGNDRLLALHRSVRDGGLGGLWGPVRAPGNGPIVAKSPSPTGCGAS